MDTLEIVKNYIKEKINGNNENLENYTRKLFKVNTKDELKIYCQENNIFIGSRDNLREDILNRIYGSCKTQLDYRILSIHEKDNESEIAFLKRVYERHFQDTIL